MSLMQVIKKATIMLGFIAYVTIPGVRNKTYTVKTVEPFGSLGEVHSFYLLTLMDGKKVYVPAMFTIIEEQ